MNLDTFTWLLSDEGQTLLTEASTAEGTDLQKQKLLRTRATAEQVALALTQVGLRRRAREKFGELAARMYFTSEGLEQATRHSIAKHRAARLQAFVANSAIDLGCGIGGDLIAFATAGITTAGIDLDPERVAVARANLAALGLDGAVQVADATAVDHSPFDVAFADPARRSGRGRSFNPGDWSPSWDFVQSLFTRDACVKVAPGIDHDLIPWDETGTRVEAEFISDRGELKEAALWSNHLATVRRRATVISPHGEGSGLATMTDEDDPGLAAVGVGGVDAFLYEPDDAVIRAGLVTAVAAVLGGRLMDPHIAYVTSGTEMRTPFARGYRVLEELPYREKALREALRERNVGSLTIKKRGVQVTPETLRRQLHLKGDDDATIVLTRVAGEGHCLRVEPL